MRKEVSRFLTLESARHAVLLAGAVALLGAAAALAATPAFVDATPADSFKVYWLIKADQPPVIDGTLDDAVWQAAAPLTDWGICDYGRQAGALGDIDFRAAWDDTYLYVGARMCHRRDPKDMEELRRQASDRSKEIYSRECLEIHIDGNLDHATRFQSIVNPLSEKWMCWFYDFGWGLLENPDYGLDADWDVAGRINEDSWTVEVRYALSDIQVKPRVGCMFGMNPCWFNWADTRENGAPYWWQYVTWSTHGDSHHDPRLYGRFILVEKAPDSLLEGLKLAMPDIEERTVMIQTPDGFTVFREGKVETVPFADMVRQEARAARESCDRLGALFADGQAQRMAHVKDKVLPEQDAALREIEERLSSQEPISMGEMSKCRKDIAEIVKTLDDSYWRVKQDVLLGSLGQ